ncbi:hypothetical protein NDU88_008202 [Pleurodeles waltl]|uniref:Uncharacterized protein n=1 Tax=Pleurodeles waltl TaxID=8319 RepID=A0AAV7VRW4_PLEWA|nr:hypothetical protein NDU88_008202 [Pleurodeles waltl]
MHNVIRNGSKTKKPETHGQRLHYLLPVSRHVSFRIASYLKRTPTHCWDLSPDRNRKWRVKIESGLRALR